MIADFLAALSFLTRIPVSLGRRTDPLAMGRAVAFFPLVGALLAVVHGTALQLVQSWVGDSWLAAVIGVSVLVLSTGAMHLDGLADTVDGFGAAQGRERALEIMREPTVGAYGVIAVVLAVAIRIAALAILVRAGSCLGLLVAILSVSRVCTAWLGWALPYARSGAGLGRMVTDGAGPKQMLLAAATAWLLAVGAVGLGDTLVLIAVTTVVTVCVGRACCTRLAGVTGDTLGANTELCELAALLAACTLVSL